MTERLLLDEIKANRSPSIQYLLFNKDSILRKYAFGYADIAGKINVDDNTTYNAYSVTKTFTALAILQLAQGNKLSLDDSIKRYLPDIPYGSDISIKHVLTHSSGIPNPIPLGWIHSGNANSSFDRNQFFKGIISKNNRTKSRPDEKYAYSNLGYVLLGQIIEKVSGAKYEEYIQNNIIKPVGNQNNEMGFKIQDPGRHAIGYHKRLSISSIILGFFFDRSEYMGKPVSKWRPFNPFYVNGASYGGLIGTPASFVKYIQALLDPDCGLITSGYKKLLFTENYLTNNQPTGMCLSWFKGQLDGHVYFTHAGGGGGYYCEIRIYPDLELGSLAFFNRTGMSDERFLDRSDKIYLRNLQSSDL